MSVFIEFGDTTIEFSSKEGYRMANLEDYLPISFPLLTAETGGGGDCFFRSLTYLLNKVELDNDDSVQIPPTHEKCREVIANYIDSVEKADEIVCDMAGQWPSKRDELMEPNRKALSGFDPVKLWNGTCVLDPEARVSAIKSVICRPGNFYWGDSITASLAEEVFGIRIACLRFDGKKVSITTYPYGTAKKLAKGSESVQIEWDRPVAVLMNHSDIHWTPVFLPREDAGVHFLFTPAHFQKVFGDILKDS